MQTPEVLALHDRILLNKDTFYRYYDFYNRLFSTLVLIHKNHYAFCYEAYSYFQLLTKSIKFVFKVAYVPVKCFTSFCSCLSRLRLHFGHLCFPAVSF